MEYLNKVSFDFDGTLRDNEDIQKYAIELLSKDYDVYIHTLRFSDDNQRWVSNWNDDLWDIVDKVGIDKNKVIFCGMTDKWVFLENKEFIWHIDDDSIECTLITKYAKPTKGICCQGNSTWKIKCNKLLNEN